MRDLWTVFRNRQMLSLTFGHFTLDSYGGVLPVLYPLLIRHFGLDLATVGLVSLAYTGMASISQPLFGVLADRWGTRFTGVALMWTATSFAAVGFMPTFPLLLVVAAASGLGSGAFHPMGALTVRGLLPKRGANTAMSVYVGGGTLGLGFGPVIGVVVFGLLAMHGTILMIVPGLVFAAFLLFGLRVPRAAAHGLPTPAVKAAVPFLPLLATVLVMGSRSWTVSSLENYTPTWYHQLGYAPWFYGPLATSVVLASALGTVGVGSISERWGRRNVIIGCLVLSVPVVALYVAFPGPQGFISGILVGLLAASTAPLMLMLAQELMLGRAGFASGLILGLGFVSSAVGTPLTGVIADRLGLQAALGIQVLVVVITIPIAWFLPTDQMLERHRQQAVPIEAGSGGVPTEAVSGGRAQA